MSSPRFERFLAQLYVERETRERFLEDPRSVAERAGLNEAECADVVLIDRVGLEMAAESFARKREDKLRRRPRWSLGWRV